MQWILCSDSMLGSHLKESFWSAEIVKFASALSHSCARHANYYVLGSGLDTPLLSTPAFSVSAAMSLGLSWVWYRRHVPETFVQCR